METEMTRNHRRQTDRQRQWIGLGAAAGGMLVAALSQFALAPSAQADPFTDVVTDIQTSITAGQADFATGATDFSNGDVPDALAYDFLGIDNVLISPPDDVLVDGFDAVTGNPEAGAYDFTFGSTVIVPTDPASTTADVQDLFGIGQTDFTAAATDFANNDLSGGLLNFADGIDLAFVSAPETGFIGLTEALLGL
jgi:hypothetical protein